MLKLLVFFKQSLPIEILKEPDVKDLELEWPNDKLSLPLSIRFCERLPTEILVEAVLLNRWHSSPKTILLEALKSGSVKI